MYFIIMTFLAMSVVGNKSDLEDRRMVSRDRGEDLAHSLGGMFTESSAANNTGIYQIVQYLPDSTVSTR